MKQAILIIVIALCSTFVASAQGRVVPNKPYSTLNSSPGVITINEVTGGFGLHNNTMPYSKYFAGFTSVTGYQVDKNFILGAGLGVLFYDAGPLVPLFLDFRYSFDVGLLSPYLYADGGVLLKFSELNYSKLFLNPGVGARYALGRRVALNISGGFLSQIDGRNRETFVTVKLGGIYKF